jgi:hypothetical protein
MWPMPIVQNFAVTGCTAAQLNFSNTMSAQGWLLSLELAS